MISGARSKVVGLVLVCAACGGEAPQVVTPPPLHITAKPPEPAPERARWVFAHPERWIEAKRELADGRTLFVGRNGRRQLVKGTEQKDAPTLAIGDLVGVLGDEAHGYTFVASDGTTFFSKDPLGPLDQAHPGPLEGKPNARIVAGVGKSSIVAITGEGKLLRSADMGATWREVDYAGAGKPYGHAGAIAIDSKGNGVLVHFPQRVFVTHDDGATWSPASSIHLGVRDVVRDANDRIFVSGFAGAYALLDGSALVRTKEAPAPLVAGPTMSPEAARAAIEEDRERTATRTLLTGDRFVELAEITRDGKAREVQIASARLGEKLGKPVANAELIGQSGMSKHVAAYGPEIVYLRDDDDPDATTPTSTLFRSKDYGATWRKDAQLNGFLPERYDESVDMSLGPKGWTYVSSLCPKYYRSGPSCERRQIRPAGAAAFEDLAFVEEFEPREFAFDEGHDKVYALGAHEGHKYVYVSPLAQNKFTRTKLIDSTSYSTLALNVDAKGEPHVWEWDYSKGAWVVHTLGADGKDAPKYLALPRGSLAFAGARGVLFASRSDGWETADGGETWIRVATNGYPRSLACSTGGCINGEAQRVGWDLPAVHVTDTVSLQADPPPPHATTTPHSYVTPVEVTCKVSGPASPIGSPPGADMVDGTAADRWASVLHEPDGRVSVIVGTKTAMHTLPLLSATPKAPAHGPAKDTRDGSRVLDDGVVVSRYSFLPRSATGTYNPVDVELGWWSATTGRVHHHTLPKVNPFRVSRYGFSGTPEIVDGGFLFQGPLTDPAYFIRDDDKVDRITLPGYGGSREVERLGKRWLVADSYGGSVRLSVSDDDGKAWKDTAWGLDLWGTVGLSRSGNVASVVYGTYSAPSLLFPVGAALADDPPTPVVMGDAVDSACDAHAGRHRFSSYISSDQRPVRVKVDNVSGKEKWTTWYSPERRITHDTASGRMCAAAYVLYGSDTHGRYDYQTVFLYPEAKGGYTAWRFRHAPDPKAKQAYVAEPLTCQ